MYLLFKDVKSTICTLLTGFVLYVCMCIGAQLANAIPPTPNTSPYNTSGDTIVSPFIMNSTDYPTGYQNQSTFTVDPGMTIISNIAFNTQYPFSIFHNKGTFTSNGGFQAGFPGGSFLNLTPETLYGRFLNDGTFTSNSAFSLVYVSPTDFDVGGGGVFDTFNSDSQNSGTFNNNGSMTINIINSWLLATGSQLNNTGTMTIVQGDINNNLGTINNNPGGTINILSGGSISGSNITNNYSTLTIQSGGGFGALTLTNKASGTITNGGNALLYDTTNEGTIINTGSILNSNSFNNSGTFNTSSGTFATEGTVTNNGAMLLYNGITLSSLFGTNSSATIVTNGDLNIGLIPPGTVTSSTYAGTLFNSSPWTLTINPGFTQAFTNPMIVSSGSIRPSTVVDGVLSTANGSTMKMFNLLVNNGGEVINGGIIDVTTAVTLQSGSTYTMEISGITPSILDSDTTIINPGATLRVIGTPITGTNLVHSINGTNGVTGTFSNYMPIGFTEIYTVEQTPNHITVTVRQPSTPGSPGGNDVGSAAASLIHGLLDNNSQKGRTADEMTFASRPVQSLYLPTKDTSITPYTKSSHEKRLSRQQSIAHLIPSIIGQKPIIEELEQYRVWALPYYAHTSSDIQGTSMHATNTRSGMIGGVEIRDPTHQWLYGLSLGIGHGDTKIPTASGHPTKVDIKDVLVGLYHAKRFWDWGRYEISAHHVVTNNSSVRYGQPVPNSLYMAKAHYKSHSSSAHGILSWRIPLTDSITVRPTSGFEVGRSTRGSFTESGGGEFNQIHYRDIQRSAEPYIGVGLRQVYETPEHVYKLSGVIEHGYELFKNSNTSRVSVVNAPDLQAAITTPGPGRHATYISAYGSVLHREHNTKLLAAYSAILHRHRTTHIVSLKLEQRF